MTKITVLVTYDANLDLMEHDSEMGRDNYLLKYDLKCTLDSALRNRKASLVDVDVELTPESKKIIVEAAKARAKQKLENAKNELARWERMT